MSRRKTTHIPRCPNCEAIMEEIQLYWDGEAGRWMECWGCDSCHSNHIFPARIEFMEAARNSVLLERSNKVLHLPK